MGIGIHDLLQDNGTLAAAAIAASTAWERVKSENKNKNKIK